MDKLEIIRSMAGNNDNLHDLVVRPLEAVLENQKKVISHCSISHKKICSVSNTSNDAPRIVNYKNKAWRIEHPLWTMKPEGNITSQQALAICETYMVGANYTAYITQLEQSLAEAKSANRELVEALETIANGSMLTYKDGGETIETSVASDIADYYLARHSVQKQGE